MNKSEQTNTLIQEMRDLILDLVEGELDEEDEDRIDDILEKSASYLNLR